MPGHLEITFGPMFSSKTTFLIDSVHRYLDSNRMKGKQVICLIVNHSSDERKRKIGNLTTHSTCSKELNKDILTISCENLSQIPRDLISSVDYIAIDESQLFHDLINRVEVWVKYMEKRVHCCGLVSDTSRNKFGFLADIIPLADKVNQKFAVCSECHNDAPFTKWIGEKIKKDQVVIGEDNYVPACGKHY